MEAIKNKAYKLEQWNTCWNNLEQDVQCETIIEDAGTIRNKVYKLEQWEHMLGQLWNKVYKVETIIEHVGTIRNKVYKLELVQNRRM